VPDSSYSRWRPHPWHGLEPGPDAPRTVNAYIEITPFDFMKYEVDKASGYLRVDPSIDDYREMFSKQG
jgi:inorganic pyrophosphatase